MKKKNNNRLNTIQSLWKNLEYRVFPVAVLRYLRHSCLSDAAILCWQTLFELAYFDQEWSVQISKNELAQELGKSSSTVSRLLEELEDNQFIERQKQDWQASILFIRIPNDLIELLEDSPRRKAAQNESSYGFSVPEPKTFYVEPVCSNSKLRQAPTPSQNQAGRGIKNDMPIKNIILNINNNHSVVVGRAEENEENKIFLSKIQTLQQQLEKLKSNPIPLTSNTYNQYQAYHSEVHSLEALLTQLQRQVKAEEDKGTTLPLGESFLTQSGQRHFSQAEQQRLLQTLQAYVADNHQRNQLTHEIAYAIRFGKLQVSYLNQQPLSVSHALNIALKLVREGRWERPAEMGRAKAA